MRPRTMPTHSAGCPPDFRAMSAGLICLLFGAVGVSAQADAQSSSGAQTPSAQSAASSGWQIDLTGYLWMSGVDLNVTGPRGRNASASYSFSEIVDHLHGIPFMDAAEIRNGRFSLIGDIIYLPVGGSTPIRNPVFSGASLNLDVTIGTVLGSYRLIEEPSGSLDIGGGVRTYGVSTLTSLHAGVLPGRAISTWASTADPVIMMRGAVGLGSGFGVLAYADVGGFGLGTKVSWQVIGGLSYEFSKSISLKLGYRYLHVEMERANVTVGIGGPFLATTFRF